MVINWSPLFVGNQSLTAFAGWIRYPLIFKIPRISRAASLPTPFFAVTFLLCDPLSNILQFSWCVLYFSFFLASKFCSVHNYVYLDTILPQYFAVLQPNILLRSAKIATSTQTGVRLRYPPLIELNTGIFVRINDNS
jgi:hypothetical protein